MSTYKKRRELIKRELKKKRQVYDTIFAFLHFPDMVQHLAFTRHLIIKEIYADLDYFVLELKEMLSDEIFLIISDHGMKEVGRFGDHNRNGFYSLNSKMELNLPKVTSFYDLIRREVKN